MALPTLLMPLLLALALPAGAQGSPLSKTAASDPTRAEGAPAPLAYRSPFEGYRPHRDIAPGPWRAMNDEVARIGGWKAYAREAHEAAQPNPPGGGKASSPAPASAPPRAP